MSRNHDSITVGMLKTSIHQMLDHDEAEAWAMWQLLEAVNENVRTDSQLPMPFTSGNTCSEILFVWLGLLTRQLSQVVTWLRFSKPSSWAVLCDTGSYTSQRLGSMLGNYESAYLCYESGPWAMLF